jgi:hypothetical protein
MPADEREQIAYEKECHRFARKMRRQSRAEEKARRMETRRRMKEHARRREREESQYATLDAGGIGKALTGSILEAQNALAEM